MNIKIKISKDRVFIYAILFSAIWHVFWISSVSVVVVPEAERKVKFSGVSFLGPILERGILKVSIEPHERTVLEKRYLADIERLSRRMIDITAKDNYAGDGLNEGAYSVNGEEWIALTVASINTQKIEPPPRY
ncbi:MAG: hypothetical protein A3I73_04810 [Omnitrophica bacterium RIFCSPLOWO2_02_FULL_45_16]|nr:MAG: hypothetical protein A3C51_02290 [Omnitrophica bacterium RIFCSPHIGHO2_02_FULL_46_20]OGW94224.1 MAG: hypothetical protein A3G36_04495 [Omnitrophica bacterium RIFCSPLOWO2_12_FULL_45_13]OGW94768.1 MAG: hypothetical protein A3K16_03430 [Omnitrophica bacterium RIFCSPLOWO2_01_FULL_45_24]OGX01034.1 MAG: hypothetical protein A3I73_04810 [Omnitrophica bacterium RIFCSPLOWO2_02_FULL_45_16]